MLTFKSSEEKHNNCFKFIGTDTKPASINLISDNTNLISSSTSLISSNMDDCMDTCSFYSGPSDAAIMAFAENTGSIAYDGAESCGSIAYSGGAESCGSIASSGSFSGCSSGGCSFTC